MHDVHISKKTQRRNYCLIIVEREVHGLHEQWRKLSIFTMFMLELVQGLQLEPNQHILMLREKIIHLSKEVGWDGS